MDDITGVGYLAGSPIGRSPDKQSVAGKTIVWSSVTMLIHASVCPGLLWLTGAAMPEF